MLTYYETERHAGRYKHAGSKREALAYEIFQLVVVVEVVAGH